MKNSIILFALFSLSSCSRVIYPIQEHNVVDIAGIIYRSDGKNYVLKNKEKIQHLQEQNLHFRDKRKFVTPLEQLIIIYNPKTKDAYNSLKDYSPPASSPITVKGISRRDWLSYFTECTTQVSSLKTEKIRPFFTHTVEEATVYYYKKHSD